MRTPMRMKRRRKILTKMPMACRSRLRVPMKATRTLLKLRRPHQVRLLKAVPIIKTKMKRQMTQMKSKINLMMLRKIPEPLHKIEVVLPPKVNALVVLKAEETSVSPKVEAEVAEPRTSNVSTVLRSLQLRTQEATTLVPMLTTIAMMKMTRKRVPLKRKLMPLLIRFYLHRILRLKMAMVTIWLRTLTTIGSHHRLRPPNSNNNPRLLSLVLRP